MPTIGYTIAPEDVGALGDDEVSLQGHDAIICGQHHRAAPVLNLGVAVVGARPHICGHLPHVGQPDDT